MSHAFISYRRQPSSTLALLVQMMLKNQHAIEAYLDTTRVDSATAQFPDRLMQAIADAPVFICFLGENTLESEWVLKEIHKAHELGKRCIPVFQENYAPPQQYQNDAVHYLLNFDGVHFFDQRNLFIEESVASVAKLARIKVMPIINAPRTSEQVLAMLTQGELEFQNNQLDVAQQLLNQVVDENYPIFSDTARVLLAEINKSLERLQAYNQVVMLKDSPRLLVIAWTKFIAQYELTPDPSELNELVTAIKANPSKFIKSGPLALQRSPLDTALDKATEFDGSKNSDWTPFTAKLGDLIKDTSLPEMEFCLVPRGRFIMGSDEFDNEKPYHEQAISKPFWMAKYPITNAQWRLAIQRGMPLPSGKSAKEWYENADFATAPVVSVKWANALTFCQWFGLRLPTEREWEYGVRGVESWLYPWGNEMEVDVPHHLQPQTTPLPIGSVLASRSWVGIMDACANVYEWTASAFAPYPYDADDGREHHSLQDEHVVRGGTLSTNVLVLRGSNRIYLASHFTADKIGFRCVLPIA
jgi:formylglycine-generating enzyme required for sulfatase activity